MRLPIGPMVSIAVVATLVTHGLSAQGKPMQATGTFDVQITPQTDVGFEVGRMTLEKQFHGDIEGTSKGMMLSVFIGPLKSGGYVAVEKVTGTLHGKRGTFVLQHSSTMDRNVATQSITVVPDSGTDDLEGISGSMVIIIDGKKHSYEFSYTIAKVRGADDDGN